MEYVKWQNLFLLNCVFFNTPSLRRCSKIFPNISIIYINGNQTVIQITFEFLYMHEYNQIHAKLARYDRQNMCFSSF